MDSFDLNDPELAEKIGDHLFYHYNRCREAMLAKKAEVDDHQRNGFEFSIGPENFPEEDISLEDVTFLTSTYLALRSVLSEPPPEVTDRREAAAILMSRQTLSIADIFLAKIALFLAMDRRYHPGEKVRIDATNLLSDESFKLTALLKTLAEMLVVVNVSLFTSAEQSLISNELRILHLSADVFFDTLESAFGLEAVGKCRKGFDILMRTIGGPQGIAAAANYTRRHKTMFRAIAAFRENGAMPRLSVSSPSSDKLEQQIASLQTALEENTRAVAKMDRRLRDFLPWLKNLIGGFMRLFRPSQPAPTHEQVAALLVEKKDRYACLQRFAEPHRSQLKAVIDYTVEHPVVYKGKTRDDFTLSNAARVVWNRNHESWEKVPGSFETFDQLKAACYNLQGKDDDPFCYQT